jgi:hypothetical protein
MTRFAFAIAALGLASPALAGTYTANPAGQPTDARIITRDVAWNRAGGVYTGRTEESRPMVLCQGLAKRAGKLESFAVNGRAFADADLAKCNSYAKDGGAGIASAN